MTVFLIVWAVVLWLTVGFSSFAYWWTTDHPFTQSEYPLAAFASLLGPIAFPLGFLIHGGRS